MLGWYWAPTMEGLEYTAEAEAGAAWTQWELGRVQLCRFL